MKNAFLNTIKALGYILLDAPVYDLPSFNLEESYKIAKHHEMSTVFIAAVIKLCENGVLHIENEKMVQLRALLLKKSIKNGGNFEKMNKFLKSAFSNNLRYAIIKGYSLAELYPFSEYRESCDTDVLISLSDEEKALSILKDNGFAVKVRTESGNHSECYSKDYGLLELHISLFYETVKNEWFGGFESDLENLRQINGIQTLCVEDSFLFLLFHSFKHFVSNVFNLKQFFDILLFLKKYNTELNKPKIKEFLHSLKIDNFLNTILTVADEFLKINANEWFNYEKSVFAKDLVEDMYNGGCFGFGKEKHGDMFEAVHYEKLKSNNGNSASKEATRWRRSGAFKTASFSLKNMKKRYTFVQKNAFLLPIAWVKHLCFIIKTVQKRPKLLSDSLNFKPKEINHLQKNRLEMLKKMGLI